MRIELDKYTFIIVSIEFIVMTKNLESGSTSIRSKHYIDIKALK